MNEAEFERQAILSEQGRILDDGDRNVDLGKVPDLMRHVGVPERLCDVEYVNPSGVRVDVEAAIKALKRIETFVGISFAGTARSGKSTAAAYVLRRFALRGKTVFWRSAEEMTLTNYEMVRGGDTEQGEADKERWRLQDVYDMIVIDNLDLLAVTDFSARYLLSIVRARADNGLVTVVTQPPVAKMDSKAFASSAVLPALSLQNYINTAMIPIDCHRVS